MQLDIDGTGQIAFGMPQQVWFGDKPNLMQVARFGGQEMMAVTDDNGAFDLHYLCFTTGGFKTIEEAKKSAPIFARKVLARLSEMIAD
ncbi:MAG: hypothetical protein Q7K26_01350 [bacterium]|nr:hypothetical protein [bacterium]